MEEQPKMLSRLWRELRTYLKTYGDVPCYIAMGDTIVPLTDSALGTAYPDDETADSAPVKMNIVLLCDREAMLNAMDNSDEIPGDP